MSNLKQLTDPLPKPWLNIHANSIEANNITINNAFVVPELDVVGDIKAGGHIHTAGENCGTVLFSSALSSAALPVGTTGIPADSSYSHAQTKFVISGGAGANSAVATTNGVTFAQLTTPFANPGIAWSDSLALWTGIDTFGTAVYTSPTAVNGTWVIGTPVGTAFASVIPPYWSQIFGRFYAISSDPVNQVYSSLNGSTYFPQPSTRNVFGFAYAPPSSGLGTGNGRLITVGSMGGMYTDDGKTWVNSASNESLSSVCYSSFYKKFVALPRLGVLGRVYTSVDGINWTFSAAPFTQNMRSVSYIDDFVVFVAGGDNKNIFVSTDGLSWKRVNLTGADAMYGGTYISDWGSVYFSGGAVVVQSPVRYIP